MFIGREAAVAFLSRSGRASDEVGARGQFVSLEGFSFAFRAKNEVWRDRQLAR